MRPLYYTPYTPSAPHSAGRKLPVRRQQAAHPLRVGGPLRILVWLELGARKLLLKEDRLECCSHRGYKREQGRVTAPPCSAHLACRGHGHQRGPEFWHSALSQHTADMRPTYMDDVYNRTRGTYNSAFVRMAEPRTRRGAQTALS